MKTRVSFKLWAIAIGILITAPGCTKDYIFVPQKPKPKVGIETAELEAAYTTNPITSVNDPYWIQANYLVVNLENLSTQHLYTPDGLLNMTGTFNGLTDFNSGSIPTLQLRAAYSNDNIYILAEWDDQLIHSSRRNWFWDGPEDPLQPGDTATGWTSQQNDDKIAFAFDINGASSTIGTFANVGCAASCHMNGNEFIMAPESGAVDIWNWSVAFSAPFGYALDMIAQADSGTSYDSGTKYFHRNSTNPSDNRIGPAFEWDGVSQDVTLTNGTPGKLDPGFFLINKVSFSGNPLIGEALYIDHDKGCEGCHGEKGEGYGLSGDGPPFNDVTFSRKYSRTTLDDFASDPDHEGNTYYTKLSASEKDDLIAYIRGLAGVPGYYLTEPVPNESITDISTTSNTNLARVSTTNDHGTYKVLFTRKLSTGNQDDITFDPSSGITYVFGVALMDNDGKNHIGSPMETLTFLSK